jgi:hypothetical protein
MRECYAIVRGSPESKWMMRRRRKKPRGSGQFAREDGKPKSRSRSGVASSAWALAAVPSGSVSEQSWQSNRCRLRVVAASTWSNLSVSATRCSTLARLQKGH